MDSTPGTREHWAALLTEWRWDTVLYHEHDGVVMSDREKEPRIQHTNNEQNVQNIHRHCHRIIHTALSGTSSTEWSWRLQYQVARSAR